MSRKYKAFIYNHHWLFKQAFEQPMPGSTHFINTTNSQASKELVNFARLELKSLKDKRDFDVIALLGKEWENVE